MYTFPDSHGHPRRLQISLGWFPINIAGNEDIILVKYCAFLTRIGCNPTPFFIHTGKNIYYDEHHGSKWSRNVNKYITRTQTISENRIRINKN